MKWVGNTEYYKDQKWNITNALELRSEEANRTNVTQRQCTFLKFKTKIVFVYSRILLK